MKRSERFRRLELELRELRRHLLPHKFDKTGEYPARILSRATAYRVLAHAEIESYLEDRAKEIVRAALRSWKEHGRLSRPLMCLLGFAGRQLDHPPLTLLPEQANQNDVWEAKLKINRKLQDASRAFHNVIGDNHGVKEANLLRLLLPVGIDPDDLDPVWVSLMNTFGELRGEAAHTSRSGWKTSQPPDPESEYATVRKVVEGLRQVDHKLNLLHP